MLVLSATSETVNSGDEVVTCDMDKTIPTLFDDWIEDISCTVLEKDLFDTYMTIIPYKDLYYVMGRTIAGVKIVIFKDTGATSRTFWTMRTMPTRPCSAKR